MLIGNYSASRLLSTGRFFSSRPPRHGSTPYKPPSPPSTGRYTYHDPALVLSSAGGVSRPTSRTRTRSPPRGVRAGRRSLNRGIVALIFLLIFLVRFLNRAPDLR